jgi:aspartate carbamoyltransferase
MIAMRHPTAGSVAEFSTGSSVPVANAGDGAGDHPSQGLLDLFTVQQEKGTLDGLTWVMVGDLKNSRVVHSECSYLAHFKGNKFIFVSPEALKMPVEIVESLRAQGFEVKETEDLDRVMGEADVLSDTRIQEERFASAEEFKKYFGVYVLTPALMAKAKKDMIVIDPLPRVNHIDPAVDSDPRAKYFAQAEYGVAMRMAILAELLNL